MDYCQRYNVVARYVVNLLSKMRGVVFGDDAVVVEHGGKLDCLEGWGFESAFALISAAPNSNCSRLLAFLLPTNFMFSCPLVNMFRVRDLRILFGRERIIAPAVRCT
jgi:hypothetical protein